MSTHPSLMPGAPGYNPWKDPQFLRDYKRDWMRRSRQSQRERFRSTHQIAERTACPRSAGDVVILGVRVSAQHFRRMQRLLESAP